MSEVQFECPHCGLMLAIDAVYAGQESTCPTCGGLFLVPQLADYSGYGPPQPGYPAPGGSPPHSG